MSASVEGAGARTGVRYIAVHGGAGAHGTRTEKEVKSALRMACAEGLSASSEDESTCTGGHSGSGSGMGALAMVEKAIVVLEDDEHLNAGYGSNLTIDGTVECDASIMASATHTHPQLFGSVGAVSGVKNPIKLARSVLAHAHVPDKLGRVPPLLLVSLGARKFAQGRAGVVDEGALVAPRALEQWTRWVERLRGEDEGAGAEVKEDEEKESLRDVEDTVGAVAFCDRDGMAAGVSSGGLLLKYPGRVGEAAVYGAGCWAAGNMACSVSGTGEHIIRESLARQIGAEMDTSEGEDERDPHEVLNHILVEFWESCIRQGERAPSVGVILIVATKDVAKETCVRMWCGFTTASMAVGYASTQSPKPKAVIFRHPNAKGSGGRPRVYITSMAL